MYRHKYIPKHVLENKRNNSYEEVTKKKKEKNKIDYKQGLSIPIPLETVDLVTLTEEIHNRKLHFLCRGKGNVDFIKPA